MKEKMLKDDVALYLFHQGNSIKAYEYLGSHRISDDEVVFRVWAPNAMAVSVIGEFNSWNSDSNKLRKINEAGVWEGTAKNVKVFDNYKYAITTRNGDIINKCDPYAFHCETRPDNACKYYELGNYKWGDEKWCSERKKRNVYSSAMNIYEVHAGSWKNHDDGSFYSYRQLADELAPYVKDMGYTHVEFMPLSEYPFDGSWGYQVTGYFAATSRYGTPDDLMYLVDKMHQNGIGVILDWVPAHFPRDAHGLAEFDGTCLYEYSDPMKGEHKEWGTKVFDFGRTEVISFLMSSANFWLDKYHIDGLRVDAVASMLYLDYGREDGQWAPNVNGGRENLEAVAFLRTLNEHIFKEHPYAIMTAEESTAWPLVSKPTDIGGLGFNFKWNMGFSNDMFEYVQTDPVMRKHLHSKLTFPLMYAFSENYILPVSHDEVVHGKKSLVDKMFGEYDDKFAGMRTFLMYMMTLPGKKLTFMGTEFAQFREWDYENELEWFMTKYPRHIEMQRFVRELNNFYLATPELWEIDDSWDGFEWIEADMADLNVISYRRKDKKGHEIIVVLNFAPVLREGFRVRVPKMGRYEEIMTTDKYEFGGKNHLNEGAIRTRNAIDGEGKRENEIEITLPALGGVILRKQTNG